MVARQPPSEILSIGDTVQVKVLDIDRDRQRISLGLKQTQEDPWQRVVDTYNVGDELRARYQGVASAPSSRSSRASRASCTSTAAQHHVENPREIIQPGDDVKVKILEIDSERRRLSLSIKRVEGQVLPQRDVMARGDAGRRRRRPRQRARAGPVGGRVRRHPDDVPAEAADGRPPRSPPPRPTGPRRRRSTAEPAERGPGRRRGRRDHWRDPPFVGLTGGIGAGKSEALAALDRLGPAVRPPMP